MTQYYTVFPQGKKKCFTMSYDDGIDFDIRFVEMMRKYGVKGTFNLNSGNMPKEERHSTDTVNAKMTMEQCIALYGDDMEIAIHGSVHARWTYNNPAATLMDIVDDRRALEAATGRIIRGGAYPFGYFDDATVQMLEHAGIEYCRTTKTTGRLIFSTRQDWLRWQTTCHHENPKLPELAKEFVESDWLPERLQCLAVWGHSYEFERKNQWELIENLLKTVSGKEDIWYCTNIELVDYCKASERLKYDLDCTKVYNPTATDIWIVKRASTEPVCIPAGKTVELN